MARPPNTWQPTHSGRAIAHPECHDKIKPQIHPLVKKVKNISVLFHESLDQTAHFAKSPVRIIGTPENR